MTEDAPNDRSRSSWPIVVVLVLVFVVYPLSVGPAVWVHATTESELLASGIEILYVPLIWLMEQNEMSGTLLRAYLFWWWS